MRSANNTRNDLHIEFYINNQHVSKIIHPETTALSLIREQLGLTGAKEVCAEGDCGACTIALGRWSKTGKFSYQAINSCILPAVRLHNSHVITVEGLAEDSTKSSESNKLHLIQQELLEQHAVQCGFCTSGMIMSLFCLLANNHHPSEQQIFAALEGNMCRCTGYQAIQLAATSLSNILKKSSKSLSTFFPAYAKMIQQQLKNIITTPQLISTKASDFDHCYSHYNPTTLSELFALMAKIKKNFKIFNGGTDLMVAANINETWPHHFIDISNIEALNFIEEKAGKIIIGGNVTFAQILDSPLVNKKLPTLITAINKHSSRQIRNIATLVGNIANASPVADCACVLLALDAKLFLVAKAGKRKIALEDFYVDYKLTALNSTTEIIKAIEIPIDNGNCLFEKTAKRRAVDISTVNSASNIQKNSAGIIKNCRIAFGGIAKFPALAKKCNEYLSGKKLDNTVAHEAANIAAKEFKPLSDVRGSAEYRNILIYNHILKHLLEL